MPKINQKNFDNLLEGLNHRMSNIENDVKLMKKLGYYMATVLTSIAIKSIFLT